MAHAHALMMFAKKGLVFEDGPTLYCMPLQHTSKTYEDLKAGRIQTLRWSWPGKPEEEDLVVTVENGPRLNFRFSLHPFLDYKTFEDEARPVLSRLIEHAKEFEDGDKAKFTPVQLWWRDLRAKDAYIPAEINYADWYFLFVHFCKFHAIDLVPEMPEFRKDLHELLCQAV